MKVKLLMEKIHDKISIDVLDLNTLTNSLS